MVAPAPRQSPEERLHDMAREVAACRDEHDVQTAAYRIVTAERDEMRRCLVAVAEAFPDHHVGARARRLLSRTTAEH